MQNQVLQFDELDSFGAGNVSPRTMKALQTCDVLDKVGVHVVSSFLSATSWGFFRMQPVSYPFKVNWN